MKNAKAENKAARINNVFEDITTWTANDRENFFILLSEEMETHKGYCYNKVY